MAGSGSSVASKVERHRFVTHLPCLNPQGCHSQKSVEHISILVCIDLVPSVDGTSCGQLLAVPGDAGTPVGLGAAA